MITIVNKHHDSSGVYVGRPTVLGNPYTLEAYTRTYAIARYRIWLRQQQFPLIVSAPYESHGSGECTQRLAHPVPSLEETCTFSNTWAPCGKRALGVIEAHFSHPASKLSRRAMACGDRKSIAGD